MQISMFEEMSIIKLTEVYNLLSKWVTPEYVLGYQEKYEIYKDNKYCIQLNVYKKNKDKETNERIIEKGVYLRLLSNGNYKISSFSSACLGRYVDYDNGIRADEFGGGRYPETEKVKFLKWFVNQNEIMDDMTGETK